MSDRYILVGQTPVPCEDLMEWAQWFEREDRHVFATHLWGGLCWVSTVFLGLDHNYARFVDPDLEPLLFETMTFWWPSRYNSHQERCARWDEAEVQHHMVVAECGQWQRALVYLLAAIRDWFEARVRDLEEWSERKEKLARGIPLETFEVLMWENRKRQRWHWRQTWKARLRRLWRDEAGTHAA